MAQHTGKQVKLPFRMSYDRAMAVFNLLDAEGKHVCELLGDYDHDYANARFIVKACNHHQQLAGVLRAYNAIVGNTGYTLDRESARKLWEASNTLLSNLDKDGE